MQEEVQTCSNCNKVFPSDRIDLHQAYCRRNIRKCKDCDMMIDINEIEQHNKQFHEEIVCQMCNHKVAAKNMPAHVQTCPKKPMFCKFCQNNWPLSDFQKHVDQCGSRTKPCQICNKRIMLKQFDAHVIACERRRQQRAEASVDHMREHGHRRNDRPAVERERQKSTNMRDPSNGSRPKPKLPDFKPSAIIGPEIIKAPIDPVPISVRLAIKNRQMQPRPPLKSKN